MKGNRLTILYSVTGDLLTFLSQINAFRFIILQVMLVYFADSFSFHACKQSPTNVIFTVCTKCMFLELLGCMLIVCLKISLSANFFVLLSPVALIHLATLYPLFGT